MSNNKDHISEEFINAFVDNELTADEKSEAYQQIQNDRDLNMRVCEIRKIRDMVQLAYREPPAAPIRSRSEYRRKARMLNPSSIAASIMLAVGVLLGFYINGSGFFGIKTGTDPEVVIDRHDNRAIATASQEEAVKVLIHLNSSTKTHGKETLDEVENLLKYYRRVNQRARVELVVNGDGLSLLRVDTSGYVERIKHMQRNYDNLTFVACQNSIDRLKREHGVTAKLIPGTVVIDSGVAQIMRRQQQGWAYIQA